MSYDSVFKPGLFADKTVVVTGGGSGIGRCTAHELAALGAAVALVGRTPEKLDTTAREIVEDGGTASTHVCDIRESDMVSAAVSAILERHGRIDGLVNNAGGQFRCPIRDMQIKGWDAVVRTNLTGGFIFSREVYLRWMESHGGAIVNMASDTFMGVPGIAHTGAARAGMINFTESAATEWAVSGVRVNAVGPSFISSEASGATTFERYTVPLQRFGTESEVSAAIVFLLSPAAAYITGSVIRIDGGSPNVRRDYELPRHDKSTPYNGFHRLSKHA